MKVIVFAKICATMEVPDELCEDVTKSMDKAFFDDESNRIWKESSETLADCAIEKISTEKDFYVDNILEIVTENGETLYEW